MAEPDAPAFDAVVVGAGPAGAAAALALARAGRSVVLVERGPFPGSKNVYGGVVYGRVLDELVPGWWDEVPVERWVVRRATTVMTPTQALTVDYRTDAWGTAPYNGMTTVRSAFDRWLAAKATGAGAVLLPSTVVTGLVRDPGGRVVGVRTDRDGAEIRAKVVVACDGVNAFLAKELGLLPPADAAHHTLGVKEVLALDPDVIDDRFGVARHQGVDMEILGCTRGVAGGGFLYTNEASVSIGVVLSLPQLAEAGVRPEELVADLEAHPSIAPLLRGAELREYAAHLIPEGGYDAVPELAADGFLVAGDAAGLTLAAGLWLEGVNFAIGSGDAAGRAVDRALTAGDWSRAGLASYRADLEAQFVLADHKRLRRAPGLVLSDRVQQRYPGLVCDLVEGMFTVTNPTPKPGALALTRASARRHGVRLRDLLVDTARGREDLPVIRPGIDPTAPGTPSTSAGTAGSAGARRPVEPPSPWRGPAFEDRMATVDFRVSPRAHITVDGDVCRSCTTRSCVTACPANLFAPTSDGGILFNYEECFECGTCYMVCNAEGAITWTYPDGGHGVVFHLG